jgi:DNA-binding MarR family transcriptional regulator
MLRTEWRVLVHLGRFGEMTARQICDRAGLHKTKVSRAVKALEGRRFLLRSERPDDRRQDSLCLTPAGKAAYLDLSKRAQAYDAALAAQFNAEELDVLRRCLKQLAGL